MDRGLLVLPLEKELKKWVCFSLPLEKKHIFPFIDMELTLFI
jgi:hypothetical protein